MPYTFLHIYQLEIQVELCAFALKGEHNVYSLVPNIAVCMCTYIDTKFSYDNNVYFSIFCEHRQLKHGMHVIDPSREVLSHCMTVQVGTSGQVQVVTSGLQVLATSGYKWLQVVTSGYKWLQVVTSGYKWLQVVLCGFMWLSCFMWLSGFMWLNGCMWLSGFMVAKSDEKWIKVVISCG